MGSGIAPVSGLCYNGLRKRERGGSVMTGNGRKYDPAVPSAGFGGQPMTVMEFGQQKRDVNILTDWFGA